MKKIITLCMLMAVLPMAFAVDLETATPENCFGTDCATMTGAAGAVVIDDCMDKLYMDVSLSGLADGNYQLTLQTTPGDKRLDSTNVCAVPNGAMGGAHANAWECGSWSDYSFYNFEMDAVPTAGVFTGSYEVTLPEGYYNVAVLVKHDAEPEGTGGASYPIILQKEDITFSISEHCVSECTQRVIVLEDLVSALTGRIVALESILPTPGPIGPQGIPGEKGDKGDKGDAGDVGAVGPQGPAGIDGVNGTNGKDGANGSDGVNGTDGAAGPEGQQGPVGPMGPQGLPGEQGLIGPEGPQGLKGDKGEPGESYDEERIAAVEDALAGFTSTFSFAFDNCDAKDRDVCRGSFSRDINYHCRAGFGVDNVCLKDNCIAKTKSTYCGHVGCNPETGLCNVA